MSGLRGPHFCGHPPRMDASATVGDGSGPGWTGAAEVAGGVGRLVRTRYRFVNCSRPEYRADTVTAPIATRSRNARSMVSTHRLCNRAASADT